MHIGIVVFRFQPYQADQRIGTDESGGVLGCVFALHCGRFEIMTFRHVYPDMLVAVLQHLFDVALSRQQKRRAPERRVQPFIVGLCEIQADAQALSGNFF